MKKLIIALGAAFCGLATFAATEIEVPTANPAEYTYTGSSQTLKLTGDAKTYTVSSNKSATAVGKYTAVVTPNKNYSWVGGSTEGQLISWEIKPLDFETAIAAGTVKVSAPNRDWTGAARTTALAVRLGDALLTVDKDYTASYANNVEVGMATITIEGKGNYAGQVEIQFEILPIDYTWVGRENGNGNWEDPMCWDLAGKGIGYSYPHSIESPANNTRNVWFTNGTYRVVLNADSLPVKEFHDDWGVNLTLVSMNDVDSFRQIYTGSGVPQEYKGVITIESHGTEVCGAGFCMGYGGIVPKIDQALYVQNVHSGTKHLDMYLDATGLTTANGYGYGADGAIISFTNCYFRRKTPTNPSFTAANAEWGTVLEAFDTDLTVGHGENSTFGRNSTFTFVRSFFMIGVNSEYFGKTFTVDDSVVGFNKTNTNTAEPVLMETMNVSGAKTKFAYTGSVTGGEGTWKYVLADVGFTNVNNTLVSIRRTAIKNEAKTKIIGWNDPETNSLIAVATFDPDSNAPVVIGGDVDLANVTMSVDATRLEKGGHYQLVAVPAANKITAPTAEIGVTIDDTKFYHELTNIEENAEIKAIRLDAWRYFELTNKIIRVYTGKELTPEYEGIKVVGGDDKKIEVGDDYVATVVPADGYVWAEAYEHVEQDDFWEVALAEKQLPWAIVAPTVNDKVVVAADVFNPPTEDVRASSGSPIVYPTEPEVGVDADGAQTITFYDVSVKVPAYFDAALDGATVKLQLNDNAKPVITNEEDKIGFVLEGNMLKFHLGKVQEGLFYTILKSSKLDGEDWKPAVPYERNQSDFEFEIKAEDGAAQFFRGGVQDVPGVN